MTLKSLYLWDVKPVKPNYGTFWSEENETEMTVQFHQQTPDIPLVAESETGDTELRHFHCWFNAAKIQNEKIQGNNLPKIEKNPR